MNAQSQSLADTSGLFKFGKIGASFSCRLLQVGIKNMLLNFFLHSADLFANAADTPTSLLDARFQWTMIISSRTFSPPFAEATVKVQLQKVSGWN